MKITIIKLLLLLLLFANCNSSSKIDIRPFDKSNYRDKEVNDSINSPVEVAAQGPIVGFFNNKRNVGDKDYYKVYFPFKTSYKLIQTAVPGIDSKITFFSTAKDRLFYIDTGKRGEAEKLWEFHANTDYVIMLVESKTGYNEIVPYVIEFYPKQNNDINEIEPNDLSGDAIPVEIEDEKKGLISPKGDIDYYKLVFDGDKTNDFSIKINTFSSLDITFTVFNLTNNTFKIINTNGWGQDEYFPFLNSSKGDILIKVSGNINPYDRQNPVYTINLTKMAKTIDNESVYYEEEFNDIPEIATTLMDGATTLGLFYPKNDMDWYKYEITRKGISVNISLSSIKGVIPKIEIYDSNLDILETADNKGINKDEDIILNDIKKGSYFLRLSSDEESQQAYRLYLNIRYK